MKLYRSSVFRWLPKHLGMNPQDGWHGVSWLGWLWEFSPERLLVYSSAMFFWLIFIILVGEIVGLWSTP